MSEREKPKTIRVYDPGDNEGEGSVGTYAPNDFRSWVHEVFLEGYKRDVAVPSVEEAVAIAEGAGCTVELDPPEDLVLMPSELDEAGVEAVKKARWWEARGEGAKAVLLVSSAELAAAGVNAEDDPADGGVDLKTREIRPVLESLKRWNHKDGFFHD